MRQMSLVNPIIQCTVERRLAPWKRPFAGKQQPAPIYALRLASRHPAVPTEVLRTSAPLEGHFWSSFDPLLLPDHLADLLVKPFRFDASASGRVTSDRMCPDAV